jgi:5-methylcytosine-specific restriction endonuclease McrA
VRLAKDVKRLPTLARAIASDKVSWTKAREIGKVATPDTERDWVERATTTSHRELVREVKQARRPKAPAAQVSMLPEPEHPNGDPPIHFGFDLTPLQAAEVHKLMDRLRPGRDRAELFLEALAALVAAEQGEQPAEKTCTRVQVAAYRCDTCSGVDVATSSGLKRLDPLSADTATCDADHIDPQGAKRSSIPPRVRRQVLARDRHRCVRCGNTRFLNIHHRHRQANGGQHTLENCVTVCAPCHRLHHANEEGATRLDRPFRTHGSRASPPG